MLKDDQQLGEAEEGWCVANRSPRLRRQHMQRPRVQINIEKEGNAISPRGVDHKIGLEQGTQEAVGRFGWRRGKIN